MPPDSRKSLKGRIAKEMVADFTNTLEKNFERAKRVVRVTKEGKVDILFKDKLTGKDQIRMYLVGKLYAQEGGFADTTDVGNKELRDELGIPDGSLYPWLKALREEKEISQVKRGRYTHHAIPINRLERTLKDVETKLKGQGSGREKWSMNVK